MIRPPAGLYLHLGRSSARNMALGGLFLLLWLQTLCLGVLGQGSVSWEMGMFGVQEGEGFVEVCAIYSGELTVETTTTEITANAGTDYIPLNATAALLVWTAGSNRSCINIAIPDDEIVETEELFFVNMNRVVESGVSPPPLLSPPVIVMIMDNDAIKLVFTSDVVMVTDDVGSIEACVRIAEGQVTEGVSFRIPIIAETVAGTAQPDVDYEPFNNMTVGLESRGILTPFNPEKCFEITVLARPDERRDERNFFIAVSLLEGGMTEPDPDLISLPAENLEVIVQPSSPISAGDIVDSVLSNPLYSVAIDTTGDTDANLCYEVHGASGDFLNLVSDECFSINAHYAAIEGVSNHNYVNDVAIRSADTTGSCVDILVFSEGNCSSAFVRTGASFEEMSRRFRQEGIQIDFVDDSVEVLMPCSKYPGGGVKVIVECLMEYENLDTREIFPVQHLKVTFNRAKLPESTSTTAMPHGLVGQFWHLHFTAERFTGEFLRGGTRDNAVLVQTPPEMQSQSFISMSYPLTWDQREGGCLYAGSRQAGPSNYVASPTDPVIQGHYSEYKVSHHFGTEYKYRVFDNSQYGCPLFPFIPVRTTG